MRIEGGKHPGDITELLHSWADGNTSALNEAVPRIYTELRRMAEARIRSRRNGSTLDGPALVNEAYLRFTQLTPPVCEDRSRFFALAATIMRGILVDHARARLANKRGGGAMAVTLSEVAVGFGGEDRVLDVANALEELSRLNARQGKIVEMRFFGGLSIEETAEALSISPATVKREWVLAKTWVKRRLVREA